MPVISVRSANRASLMRARPRSRHSTAQPMARYAYARSLATLFVAGFMSGGATQCPLWVISGHLQCKKACPLYPQKRTCAVQLGNVR